MTARTSIPEPWSSSRFSMSSSSTRAAAAQPQFQQLGMLRNDTGALAARPIEMQNRLSATPRRSCSSASFRPMTLSRDDDDFDDFKLLESRGLTQEQEDYWASVETNEQIREARKANPERRGAARKYGKDGVVDTRMTQTEVALRLARHLAESPLIRSTVYVQIGGAEVNRRGDDVDVFPVSSYVARWGFSHDPGRVVPNLPDWIGFYTSRRTQRKLLVNFNKHDGHIMAFFTTGQRLIVHCTAGNVGNTRSPAEHHDLHRAMGRAIGWAGAKLEDVTAVCMPRSERFRKMTAERSASANVKKAGLLFFHVDRGGGMIGLPET